MREILVTSYGVQYFFNVMCNNIDFIVNNTRGYRLLRGLRYNGRTLCNKLG